MDPMPKVIAAKEEKKTIWDEAFFQEREREREREALTTKELFDEPGVLSPVDEPGPEDPGPGELQGQHSEFNLALGARSTAAMSCGPH